MRRFNSLEALRAIAALLVVMFHTQTLAGVAGYPVFGWLFADGDKGVDLFFVLSGFIMMTVHRGDLGRPTQLGNYAISRVFRIYPNVWIVSALALVTYLAGFGGETGGDKLGTGSLISSFLLLPQAGDALVNVTWTLKYEIFFYALFGLLLVRVWLGAILLALWQAAIIACMILSIDTSPLWGFYLRPIACEFGIGCLVALLVTRHGAAGATPRTAWAWASLLIGGVAFVIFLLQNDYYPGMDIVVPRCLTFGIAAALIIYGCCILEVAGRLKVGRFLVFLGGASYAIYLVHFPVVRLGVKLVTRLHPNQISLAGLGVAAIGVSVGVGFHLLVDRPLGRRLQRLRRRRIGEDGKVRQPGSRVLPGPARGQAPGP
jgi:exopolysaccharide production protein ExoZ